MATIYEKLAALQFELKAPKGQYNKFGKYKYRSCEDILEAAKPLCMKYGLCLTISDEINCIGDRYYICATATIIDPESGENVFSLGFAREDKEWAGMSGSQITGSASSYARKYALNGLLCIDDTKDSDATNTGQAADGAEKGAARKEPVYKCDECGKVFEPFQDKSGKVWTAKQQYDTIKSVSTDGKVKCSECRKKEAAEKQQEENK